MNKKIPFYGAATAVLLFSCIDTNAQSTITTLTPAVGFTSGKQSNSGVDGKQREKGAIAGLTVRISTRYERLQFLTGLEYIQKATQANAKTTYTTGGAFGDDTLIIEATRRERYSYVQIPIALQYRLYTWGTNGRWSIYGMAGISSGFALERVIVADGEEGELTTTRTKAGKVERLNRTDLAGLAGVRIARRLGPGSLSYEVRKAYSLYSTINDAKRRNNVTSYQLGYTFALPRKNP